MFRANELAKVLGYVDADQAICKHVREKYCVSYHDLNDISHTSDSLGVFETTPVNSTGSINGYWIKEYGLYSLLTRSKMPYAIVFQDWLFEKVLPSIRRTGSYSIAQDTKQPAPVLPPPTLPRLMTSNEPEIENLSEYPALSVIHNAIYILECLTMKDINT